MKIRIFAPHALNQRSPTEDKGQKLTEAARPEQNDQSSQKQHALNQWSSAEGKVFYKQHALKGQKLLAQGNALGCYVRKLVAL